MIGKTQIKTIFATCIYKNKNFHRQKNRMKLNLRYLVILIICLYACNQEPKKTKTNDPVSYVNALVGTNANNKFSHGNTYPAVALPWGMNFWTPQTGTNRDNWIYTYHSDSIRGFRQAHLPSPWIGDYGAFSLMPVSGKLKFTDRERAAYFSHHNEMAQPYYYQVLLPDEHILAEITPTQRCARMRFTFGHPQDCYVVLDAFSQGSKINIDATGCKITGWCRNNSGGAPENFACYFVMVFDEPFEAFGTWTPDSVFAERAELECKHTGAYLHFGKEPRQVNVRIASSFISIEQAIRNLEQEIAGDTFDTVCQKARNVWNQHLERIVVEGGTDDQLKTFYSNFYRVLLYPRTFYEFDDAGNPIHYSPYNGKVEKGYMFTDNGFWDTFRSAHPFYVLMFPEQSEKIMQALVNSYNEGGWLPSWASPGYRNAMIGAHAASLITNAYGNGIRNFDVNKAYEAVLKDCFEKAPRPYMGRYGFDEYNKLGYVPFPEYKEAVSATLEYAYDDYCIMKLAEMLGKTDDVAKFRKRAENYKNVFEPKTRFMRARRTDGNWFTPFSPFQWGGPFTEGNSWQYSWSVFHDPQGLINLMGGNKAFVLKMDSVFTVPAGRYSLYDREYNEVFEMFATGMGQYAHGNQPIQHMLYLYNYAGEPHKSQQRLRTVMDELYSFKPSGYCGDEDNGQTSSWYLFSALGFYPVCPGSSQYVLGSPIFQKATLNLANGQQFVISAPDNAPANVFVKSTKLNGNPYSKLFLTHNDIMSGGIFELEMGTVSNKNRTFTKDDLPFSLTK